MSTMNKELEKLETEQGVILSLPEAYDEAKKHIIPRLVWKKENEDSIKDYVQIKFLDDLAITFIYVYRDVNDEIISSPITKEIQKKYGIDDATLLKDAVETAEKVMPSDIEGIDDVLNLSEDDEDPNVPEPAFYVATNRKRHFGAAVILYKGLLKGFGDRIRDSFYVVPSSIHEVLFIPKSMGIPADEIRDMVVDVNENVVKPAERLDDRVYYYDHETDKLAVA